MKLEIDSTELVNALALASKAVADRGSNLILESLYLKAANDKLQLVGSDGMIVEVAASVDREGAATVPTRLMLELCSALPANSLSQVSIELEPESYKMVIALESSYRAKSLHGRLNRFCRLLRIAATLLLTGKWQS